MTVMWRLPGFSKLSLLRTVSLQTSLARQTSPKLTMIFEATLVAALFSWLGSTPISGQSSCFEGQQFKRDRFWYECVNGRETPIACVAPDGNRIELGSSYQSDTFVVQCSQPSPGTIQVLPVACVNRGNVVSPGAIFSNDQTFYYRCARSGQHSLRLELAGCVGGTGELIVNNGVVKRGAFVYRCVVNADGINLEPEGCVFEGRQYRVGQDIETPAVWYRCEADAQQRGMSIKLKGCVHNGQKYTVNERFVDGAFSFQCRQQGNSIFPVGVGCVHRQGDGTVKDYSPGSRWLVGDSKYNRYQMECRLEGLTIRVQAVQCYYEMPEGLGYLQGGCMRKVGQTLIMCAPSAPATPNVRIRITENPTPADEQRQQQSGFRFC